MYTLSMYVYCMCDGVDGVEGGMQCVEGEPVLSLVACSKNEQLVYLSMVSTLSLFWLLFIS